METDRRQYIRLDSVFPVVFRLLGLDGKSFLSDELQGFTNNIGKGGICLTINKLKPELAALITTRQAKVSLNIEIPLGQNPVSALAKVVWTQQAAHKSDKLLIGLSYEEIAPLDNQRLIRYVRTKKLFAPVAFSIIFLLASGVAVNSYLNIKLIKGNKALVAQLIGTIQESAAATQKISAINKEKKDLGLKIKALGLRTQALEEEKQKAKAATKKIEELNLSREQLKQEKASLQGELIALQQKETSVTQELLEINKKRAVLEKANFEKMYQWLSIHQNPRTGLVMSFEGDANIAEFGFIYDQSLASQAYTYFNDFERARKVLDFFLKKAKRQDKRFFNAYYVNDAEPAEYIIHSGPNIWLGIAIAQYTQKTKDTRYLTLAEEIAESAIDLQNQSQDGGIRGGPDVSWYSTEHNLDAYALFNMLYKITGKPLYLQVRDKTLGWLLKTTYDKADIPIKRGKGDSTIATDTYAWAIAAIGPEKLAESGMSPDRIMEFAETHCAVEVGYLRPEGKTVKIKGFDFAAQHNVARGGIISSEWTAQMVIAFKIMADFYYKKNLVTKAKVFEAKAEEYLAELSSMVISSPSPSGQGESCLPYATESNADTGHGWSTPKGNSTGSVAGTAYTIFAYYKYNPLELKE